MNVSARHLHRIARALGWILGVAVISLAVLAGLIQLLLPTLASHPQWVAAQLSRQLERPVTFSSLEGRWEASGPLFVMRNMVVAAGPGESPLSIPETELKLDLGGWLMPSRHLVNLRVRGMQLDLSRGKDGSWHINGIGVAGGGERQRPAFGRLSVELWLRDLRLDIADENTGKHYALLAKQLRVSRQGGRVRVGAILQREGVAGELRGAGNFREDGADGRLWIAASKTDLHAFTAGVDMGGYTVDSGSGSFASWLDWRDAKVVRSLTRLDLDGLALTNPDGHQAHVASLHALGDMHKTEQGFRVRWGADDGGALALDVRNGSDGHADEALIAARDLQLSALAPWAALKPELSPGMAQWLGTGKPRGKLGQVALRWTRADGLASANIGFSGLGIDAVGKLPGIDHLDGVMRGDAGALSVELPAQNTVLRFPHTFRKPFVLPHLAGSFAVWHEDGDWHIGIEPLAFEGEGFGGQARGEIQLHDAGGRPFLDLYAELDHADMEAAKLFWPIDSMSPQAIDWLDRALVSGKLRSDMLVRGDLKDWPFHTNEGRFEARAEISELALDYGKSWPRADGITAVASFVNNSMLVEASGGDSLGVKAERVVAVIPDLGHTVLDLNVQGSGSGASLMEFVKHSPIGSRQADALNKLSMGGAGTFDFHLSLPVNNAKEFFLTGTTELKDVDLSAPDWNLKLDKINGPGSFDGHGFHAGPLDAVFRGQPSKLDIAIAAATGKPDTEFSARLSGRYGMAEMVQGLSQLDWLKDVASGRSDTTVGFDIVRQGSVVGSSQLLTMDTNFVGMALDLPAPLKKSAEASLPTHLALGLPVSGGDLQIALGQVMRQRFRLPDDKRPLGASFALGTRMPDTVPDKGIRVRGRTARMDVTGWVQRAAAGSASGGPGLESIDISADQAEVFGHAFPSMRIQAAPENGQLNVDVDSADIVGRFVVPTDDLDKRGVTARLQRLYWPKTEGKPTAAKTAGGEPPKTDPANTGITPSALPPFHLWVGDLRFGESRLGEARLETWPTDRGMHIDQLRALSRSVQINASGDWEGTASNSHSHLRIDFAAESLGDMLGAFGFAGMFNGGKTRAHLDATWPGAPSAMELANMDGRLSMQVTDGSIPEVAPGVGRLFGLISLVELPRRLTLDFGDVFGKGLAFDSITGDFALGDGNATTNNLSMRGPAVEITIKGRTGLRAKDYDQQALVIPHVGNSLPIVGAVVAGPIGAAAGFVAQGLLGRGINRVASARYHIGGSWDKPDISLVEKKNLSSAEAAASTAVPAPAASAPAPASSAAR